MNTMPKIELHCHLDGSVRPETLFELAKHFNIDVPTHDFNAFLSLVRVPESCDSLVDYLNRFKLPIAVMQTSEVLKRIASEVVEDVALHGVKYIEIRFAPHLHMEKNLSFETIVESVLEGLKVGMQRTGIIANLILCCMRHNPVSTSIEVVEKGRPYLGKGVVAIDLAGDEHNYPPEIHKEAFDLAKSYGYRITVHAGETGIGSNVTKSIQLLHAERIGHGLFIKDDSEAYQLTKTTRTPLEMCPTSNLQTKAITAYASHPLIQFMDDGIVCTINTDNMTVSNIDLEKECHLIATELGATVNHFKQAYENGIEASFATDDQKSHLRTYLSEFDTDQ